MSGVCPHCYRAYDPIMEETRETRDAQRAKEVMRAVCEYQGVDEQHLIGPKRARKLVEARQTIAWILHRKLGYTLKAVGEFLSRDHSTVMDGVHRFDRVPSRVAEAAYILKLMQQAEVAE